ncbi:hypothetical protein [Chryseobacterium sp. GVT01B]|uniref:hypothetical protein n=1 Tax=Chryseobacterium sp. GVT01B TaxID=2862675 RepID=UPI001CC12D45|nr:hypothetical protein [Chryseobacterium sp. GVT01B]
MTNQLNYIETPAHDFIIVLNTFSKINRRQITQSLQITNLNITSWNEITINNCVFNEEVVLKELNIKKSIRFSNCTFSKRFNLTRLNSLNTVFENCIFEQYISFKEVNSDSIRFKNCTFNNYKLTQLHEFSCQNFYFLNNSLKSDIHFKPTEVKRIILEGSESNNLITISYLNRNQIIDEILLLTYQGYKTEYFIRNLSTKKLQIAGEIKDSSIILSRVAIGTAILENFSNFGNFKITDLEALDHKSNIILKNSNLGKVQVSSIDFSKFKRILINNTNIMEIIPVNINWCFKNIYSESLTAKKENFRQLKLINQKNEDIDSKLKYEKYEMHTFLKLSRENKGDFKDKFILITNYLSNDFGLSWTRSILILFIFSIICYTLIKIQLGHIYFHKELIADEIGYFLNFVNPVHLFEKIFPITKNDSTNGAVLIDSLAKIINAYLIFQLVSAFRKYSKK